MNAYDVGCFCDAWLSGFALIFNSTIRTIANTFISLSVFVAERYGRGGGMGMRGCGDGMSFTLHCAASGGMETESVQMEAISN